MALFREPKTAAQGSSNCRINMADSPEMDYSLFLGSAEYFSIHFLANNTLKSTNSVSTEL